jgi:Putative Flp pilus-assembly TadE/G-like
MGQKQSANRKDQVMAHPSLVHRRRGFVAPLVAVLLLIIIGVGALAIDASLLMADRRKAQAGADAAALAAAIDMFQNWSSNRGVDPSPYYPAATSARNTAADNGFTNGSNGVVVTVNIPPTSGSFVGLPGYAEVIITMQEKRFLSGIWGSGKLSVAARAVARGTKHTPDAGLLVLDPTGSNTLVTSNSGGITVNGGDIIVNSSDANAGHISNGGNIQANNFYFTGTPGYGSSGSGAFSTPSGGTFNSNQTATPDPLATLAYPSQPGTTYTNVNITGFPVTSSGSVIGFATPGDPNGWTLPPGTYSGGIHLSDNNSAHTYTLQSGLFYFTGGGLSLSGNAAVTSGSGGNLLFFNDGGGLSSTHQDALTLNPMTTGTYANITIFQSRSNTSNDTLTGQTAGGLTITGTIYTPAATFTLTGAGSNYAAGSQYIVYKMSVTGSGQFNINHNAPQGPPGRQLFLVE